MQELMLPVRHEWLARERAYGKIAIEPFEPGFALTAGNAYRRVLLSSIAGAAPTWVKIESVLHEFSYLPGVREDTLDIILNLRKLVFTLHVFFEENCSPSLSSRRLSIHRNTLSYRLDKITSLTGLDPRQFDQAVQIRLALLLQSVIAPSVRGSSPSLAVVERPPKVAREASQQAVIP